MEHSPPSSMSGRDQRRSTRSPLRNPSDLQLGGSTATISETRWPSNPEIVVSPASGPDFGNDDADLVSRSGTGTNSPHASTTRASSTSPVSLPDDVERLLQDMSQGLTIGLENQEILIKKLLRERRNRSRGAGGHAGEDPDRGRGRAKEMGRRKGNVRPKTKQGEEEELDNELLEQLQEERHRREQLEAQLQEERQKNRQLMKELDNEKALHAEESMNLKAVKDELDQVKQLHWEMNYDYQDLKEEVGTLRAKLDHSIPLDDGDDGASLLRLMKKTAREAELEETIKELRRRLREFEKRTGR
ncbi:hypothetical protein MFIFM68171_06744 [Madurella fahalii]|uniref:Uncharacterized protein n=1 Tax=Madurella fahalii TaxID=1157608 RepID=A0ABQ0GFM6_9PEZI